MASRWADWFRQAQADLALAKHALEGGHHEWACFAAQQAAEKALKAVHGVRGEEAWGHSVTELLDSLRAEVAGIEDAMPDRGRALDKLYIATRYPNGLRRAPRRLLHARGGGAGACRCGGGACVESARVTGVSTSGSSVSMLPV